MNIVFFGTSAFGIPALEALLKAHTVQAVVTTPDKHSGRKLQLQASPIKERALEHHLPVFEYRKEQPGLCLGQIKPFAADVFVVVSFGALLNADFLTSPRLYALNIHASLLPKYRGASPMQSALLNGEKETGVCVIRMFERLDAGDVVIEKKISVPSEMDRPELEEKLSMLGADAILEALDQIERQTAKFTVQDERVATYAKKIKKEDGKIDWRMNAGSLHDRVRAFAGWPGTYFFVQGKRVLVCRSRMVSGTHTSTPGTVLKASPADGLEVACGEGTVLALLQLQLEGRKKMSWADFSRGFTLKSGDVLE